MARPSKDMRNIRLRPTYSNGKLITDPELQTFEVRAVVYDDRKRRRELQQTVIGLKAAQLWRDHHRTWASIGKLGDQLKRNDYLQKYTLGDAINDYTHSQRFREKPSSGVNGKELEDFKDLEYSKGEHGTFLRFKRDFPHLCKKPVIDITSKDWKTVRDRWQYEEEKAAGTIKRDLSPFRDMYNFLIKDNELEVQNTITGIELPKEEQRKRVLKPAERLRLYQIIEGKRTGKRWLAMMIIALHTALRRGVLLQLEWKDIDWDYDNRCLNIPENYVHWRKKAPPIVPLSQLAYWTLNAYKNTIPEHLRKPNAKVFQIKERNHALEWERICDAANIDDLHWHDLRRTAITTWQDPRLPRDLQLTSQEIAYIGWNSPPRDGHKMAGTYTANEAIHIANAIRDRLDGIDAAYYRDPERSGPPLDEIAQRRAFELPEEVRRRQPFDEDAGKALWQWEDDTYGLGTTMWTDEHGVKHWVNYGPVIDGKRQITRGTGEYPDT